MNDKNRRQFLASTSTFAFGLPYASGLFDTGEGPTSGQERKLAYKGSATELKWYEPSEWGVEGRGFSDTKQFYNRLPARAESVVRDPVWRLSQHTAGMSVGFKTNASSIQVRYRLTNKRLAMPHMPATSVSGVDLYARDDEGRWKWAAVLKPGGQDISSVLLSNIVAATSGPREYKLYLPLYNGVEKLQVGVAASAMFVPVPPRDHLPIVFYGTSIMQGACASRSGMAIPAILERRLNRATLNLGFSGNGRMETEVGRFLTEISAAAIVIDCLPNMNGATVTERCVPLVKQIRKTHPKTPILLVEDRVGPGAWLRRGALDRHATNRAALKRAMETLQKEGVPNLYYLSHENLLGADHDATTDGSHPSDLGMVRYADAYEPVLRKMLGESENG